VAKTSGCAHLPVAGIPEPVTADHLADVAERTTAEQIGKLKT
jgi:hypothetical protein